LNIFDIGRSIYNLGAELNLLGVKIILAICKSDVVENGRFLSLDLRFEEGEINDYVLSDFDDSFVKLNSSVVITTSE